MGRMPRVRTAEVADLLGRHRAVATERTRWASGEICASAYLGAVDLPPLVTRGVRCLVVVGSDIVVCENAGGVHPWPGGGREPGETMVQAARREVHEETGWVIDEATFAPLGWLHLENLSPVPDDHPYPYPDCLYLVGVAEADAQAPRPDAGWVDTEGYELRSWLVPRSDAAGHIRGDPLSVPFLQLVDEQM